MKVKTLTLPGKDDEISVQFPHKEYWRAKGCWLMCDKEDSECVACTDYMEYMKMQVKQTPLIRPLCHRKLVVLTELLVLTAIYSEMRSLCKVMVELWPVTK